MFIKQIFFGVLRYKKFLQIFTDVFFTFSAHTKNSKDEIIYFIIIYITIFRFDEIPFKDYKSLLLVSFILFN
jgi:hypothetical protein